MKKRGKLLCILIALCLTFSFALVGCEDDKKPTREPGWTDNY